MLSMIAFVVEIEGRSECLTNAQIMLTFTACYLFSSHDQLVKRGGGRDNPLDESG